MAKIQLSPKTKDVLTLVGGGVLLSSLFIAPGTAVAVKAIMDLYKEIKREREWKEWQKFNLPRLRFLLRRMMRQRLIRSETLPDGTTALTLTQKGRLRSLKYNIEDMHIEKPKAWDGKWRVVIYDITKFKKREQSMLRRMLKKLKMLPLQKSIYLYPYPCESELTFLRSYFDVDEGVLFLRADHIENEELFRRYFGL